VLDELIPTDTLRSGRSSSVTYVIGVLARTVFRVAVA
jgi:hypothetical protein